MTLAVQHALELVLPAIGKGVDDEIAFFPAFE